MTKETTLRSAQDDTSGPGNAHIVYNKFPEINIFFRKNANLSLFDIAGIYILRQMHNPAFSCV